MNKRSTQLKKIRKALLNIYKDNVVTPEEEQQILTFYEWLPKLKEKDPKLFKQVDELFDQIRAKFQSRLGSRKEKSADKLYDTTRAKFLKDGNLSEGEKKKLRELDARRDLLQAQNKALRRDEINDAEQKKIDEALARLEAADADLSKNTQYARQAVKYVLSKLKMKAANWDDVRNKTDSVLAKHRAETGGLYQGGLTFDEISIIVAKAEHHRVGNCDEMSLVSFRRLEFLGAYPIHNMCLGDNDHCFNVIGRSNADPNDWENWGEDAVVCDPWAAGYWGGSERIGAYPASIFGPQMSRLMAFSRIRQRYPT